MKTIELIDLDPDTQVVIEHAMTGKTFEPEIARRLRAEGEKCGKRFLRPWGHRHSVPAIRELRRELPTAPNIRNTV